MAEERYERKTAPQSPVAYVGHSEAGKNQDAIQNRLYVTGQHLSQWEYQQFEEIVSKQIDDIFESRFGVLALIVSAVSTVLSAGLNLYYLLKTAIDLWIEGRKEAEDYNLTEWIVVTVEVITVYYLVLRTLFYFFMMLCSHGSMRDHPHALVQFTHGFKQVSIALSCHVNLFPYENRESINSQIRHVGFEHSVRCICVYFLYIVAVQRLPIYLQCSADRSDSESEIAPFCKL